MSLEKIDKFYFVFFAVLAVMAGIVIFTFRTIFTSFILAYELTPDDLAAKLKIKEEELETAHQFVEEKNTVPLEIR